MRNSLSTLFVVAFLTASSVVAAPNITNVSLRGLQIGGTTTLIIEGSELLPNPVIVAPFPITSQSLRPNAQPNRIELDVTMNDEASPGIFPIRLGSGKGISNSVIVGVDRLPQQTFVSEIPSLPVALHGTLSGTQILSTRFRGTKGQKIVMDVEVHRLGANFKPVLRVKDARGRQLAWSAGTAQILADARTTLELREDGTYTVELHDVLYRAAAPGYFRLKIGELTYADLAFPLAVQADSKATVHFSGSNLPDASTVLDVSGLKLVSSVAAPLRDFPFFSGSPPRIVLSQHAEVVEESRPPGQPQSLAAIPIGVSGRLINKGEEDQYVVAVTPGSRVRVEVYAQRIGSPLDGVLSLRNEQGTQVATSDDRPAMSDPGVDFAVPADMNKLVLAVRDLVNRGGDDYVYRIEVTDLGQPTFGIVADTDRVNIPAGATQVIRLQSNRTGYGGPIQLSVEGLPSNVELSGQEIPAGAAVGLLTLTAGDVPPFHALTKVVARGTGEHASLLRVAQSPEASIPKRHAWMREEIAISITEPAPVNIAWADTSDSPLLLGEKLPVTVAIQRKEGAVGGLKLRLLTTQVMPRKKTKEKNQEKEVDDVDRALRLDGDGMVAADAKQATVNIMTPADLPARDWGLVLAGDLLGTDNKTVIATTTTTVISKRPIAPFSIEVASAESVEAKAGLGDTGKLTGKVRRQAGFSRPVAVTLKGLPKEYPAPFVTVPAEKEDFEFPVRFPFGSQPAELKDVKLVAVYQPNPQNADLLVQSIQVPVGIIKVVPGEPPPASEPLAIFEDDEKFVSMLSKGEGLISLETLEKYSGNAAVKIIREQRYGESLPMLNVKIRENPGAGEYRFLRFAWKKKGGSSVCLQINHDGAFGPGGSGKPGAKFRYHAGPGGECYGASVIVGDKLPDEFVVVTRDLFADFGEFTFTGLGLAPVDGGYAVFDHLYLAHSPADLDKLKKP